MRKELTQRVDVAVGASPLGEQILKQMLLGDEFGAVVAPHLREQGLKMPLFRHGHLTAAQAAREDITGVEPTYHAVHNVLTHPAYAGAYTYGRSRQDKQVRADGTLRVRRRVLPQDQWQVLIKDHHEGYISWDAYLANQARIGQNIRPMAHEPGALLLPSRAHRFPGT